MAWSIGVTNPFLRPPGAGAAETAARGAFYGAKIRTGAFADPKKSTSSEPKLYWVYGKKTWANCNGLGFPPGKLNNTTTGLLSLYSPRSNLPLMPVLTGVDTTNEGAMGSVIKATVSFTMYPSLTESGVAIERIQSSFFTPGGNVSCQFGWSTYAAIRCASRFGFSGKVVSFSWSVNTDVSVSASSSIIAPGSIATGVSTNMQQKTAGAPPNPSMGPDGKPKAPDPNANNGETSPSNPLDAKAIPVPAADLGTAIDNVMAELNPIESRQLGQNGSGNGGATGNGSSNTSNVPTTPPAGGKEEIYGIKAWDVENAAGKYGLRFCAVGIPWMPEPPETDEVTSKDEAYAAEVTGGGEEEGEPVDEDKKKKEEAKKIQDQIDKLNTQGAAGEKPKPIVKKFWYVQFGSMENYLSPLISGATNGNVRRVDIANLTSGPPGPAGYISAYPMEVIWPGSNYGNGTPPLIPDRTPIGSIWFNTDYMKETWRKYFNETNTKTSQKKLTQFLTELGNRANEAAGDYWQLSCTVIEKFNTCGEVGGRTSVLSVEDFSYVPDVGAFSFNASFGRPMLKNVSVSCKSSSTMGAAVMAGGNVDTPGKPGVTWSAGSDAFIGKLKDIVKETGINTAWGDAMKGVLKMKKKEAPSHHSKINILFPIDFSVTVDGCSGWQFNEAVNTNLKPPGYGGSKFAISGISNKIDVSSWETSLTAMMRS
jgi:hypothetical protein